MGSILDIIAIPFSYIMQFCYWIAFDNYFLALVYFTLIIEIVLLPFAIKQQKNSIKAAKLRPKEMAIRKKYAGRNDQPTQQKMMTEIQEMQQKEGYSPFSGCLQLLIQLPLISALYSIITNPFRFLLNFSPEELNTVAGNLGESEAVKTLVSEIKGGRTTGLIDYINKNGTGIFEGIENFAERLERMPKLSVNVFGLDFNLAAKPGFDEESLLLLIIPALTFLVYFLTSKLSRKFIYQPQQAADDKQVACSNTMMDFMMPAMSTYFAFQFPAAIGIYWIIRSVFSTIKQFIVTKLMPLPKFTEEDYKAAELEYKGKASVKRELDPNRPKVRSLHHIDDEDYELPAKDETKKSAKPEEKSEAALPEEKEVGGIKIEQAPKKKDDRK